MICVPAYLCKFTDVLTNEKTPFGSSFCGIMITIDVLCPSNVPSIEVRAIVKFSFACKKTFLCTDKVRAWERADVIMISKMRNIYQTRHLPLGCHHFL